MKCSLDLPIEFFLLNLVSEVASDSKFQKRDGCGDGSVNVVWAYLKAKSTSSYCYTYLGEYPWNQTNYQNQYSYSVSCIPGSDESGNLNPRATTAYSGDIADKRCDEMLLPTAVYPQVRWLERLESTRDI
ncbi:hypothetical protein V1524DRAFT_437222, partial [Lipomyces starkeyi]